MRLLFATSEVVTPERCDGGLANYLQRLTVALADRGHEPIIVAPGAESGRHLRRGVRVETVPAEPRLPERLLNLSTLRRFDMLLGLTRVGRRLARRIGSIAAAEPVDLVQYAHLGGHGAFRLTSVPTVVRLASSTTLARRLGGYDHQSAFAMAQQQWLENRALGRADAVFCPGVLVAEAVAMEIGRSVEVIETPFFVEVEELDPSLLDGPLAGRDFLLFVGLLNTLKGLPVIAEMIGELLRRHSGLVFAFAGREYGGYRGGTMIDHLRTSAGSAADRVMSLGLVPHQRLYPLFARARAVVLPSLTDNQPNAALEAMSHSAVVVGTRRTGFAQLIDHGESGLLCEPGDARDLLVTVERALALTDDERWRMGERARSAVARFHPDVTVERHLDLYRRVIGEAAGASRGS